MSRDRNEVELKVVEEPAPVTPGNSAVPIKLNELRAERSPRNRGELRSRQPGIEALIERERVQQQEVEDQWQQGSTGRPFAWGWFVVIGTVICCSLLWSLFMVRSADTNVNQIRTEAMGILAREESELRDASFLIERIENTLRAYYAADGPVAINGMVRQPERVAPLMAEHYRQVPRKPRQVREIRKLEPLTLGKRGNFWRALVLLDDGSLDRVAIEISEHGTPKIDWETHVCHQPMAWDVFAQSRPKARPMDFRVQVEPADRFQEPENTERYRLRTLDGEATLYGRVMPDSTTAETLAKILKSNGGRKTSLILRLIIPNEAFPAQEVLIEKVVNDRWIYVDDPHGS